MEVIIQKCNYKLWAKKHIIIITNGIKIAIIQYSTMNDQIEIWCVSLFPFINCKTRIPFCCQISTNDKEPWFKVTVTGVSYLLLNIVPIFFTDIMINVVK